MESTNDTPFPFDSLTDSDCREIEARLRARCALDQHTDCWTTLETVKQCIRYKQRTVRNRVLAWAAVHRRELPPTYRVKPECGTKACVNPQHMTCVVMKSQATSPIETWEDNDFRTLTAVLRKKSVLVEQTSCWNWTGGPRHWFKGHTLPARAYAWISISRRRPQHKHRLVATCDNDLCVNPGHLVEQRHVTTQESTGLTYYQRCRKRVLDDPEALERHRKKSRDSYRCNPDVKLRKLKRGAMARKITWSLSDEEAYEMIRGRCHYCGIPSAADCVNGIDRKDSALEYIADNCVSCCAHCNLAKGCLSDDDFIRACCHIAAVFGMHDGKLYPRVFSRAQQTIKEQLCAYRRRSRKEGRKKGDATFTDALIWYLLQAPCTYCGLDRANGIDRIDSKLGYVASNVTSACYTCNRMKLGYDLEAFFEKCWKVALVHGPMLVAETLAAEESSIADDSDMTGVEEASGAVVTEEPTCTEPMC